MNIDKSKPVLVTGATGFVASWLVKKLLEEGITVHAAVRDPNNTNKIKFLDDLAANSPGEIKYFKSDYKWNISATPFTKGLSSFIYNTNCITNSSFELDNIYNLHEDTVKSLNVLYRRNTRESVQNEFSGNIIKELLEVKKKLIGRFKTHSVI